MLTLIVMELVFVVAVATLFAADMVHKGWPYI